MTRQRNWAGNLTYHAANWHSPRSVGEVRERVRRADRVKVLGSRHSFNGIADTDGAMLSLEHLNRVVGLDRERGTVTVEGGIRYGELSRFLHGQGYALPNLASLPHISVAGACMTATHGSGDRVGNLATAVSALELVTADGEVVEVSREGNPETFPGMVVGLGGLGIVTRLTLDVMPTFEMRQDVYEDLALEVLETHFDAVLSSADSVSLFTDWRRPRFYQAWLKRRVTGRDPFGPPREWFGARPAPGDRHPIPGLSPVNCTPQMGVPGPWHERLPHFRLEYTPSSGEELQSEYLVPRQHALAAFRAIHALGEQMAPILQVAEVRSVAADDLWMSPFYRQPCVGLHFTWRRDEAAVRAFLPHLEAALAPLAARPHWGKVFTLPPEALPGLFEKLPDFRRLLEEYDPQGKFRNAFLDRYIFGAARPGVPEPPTTVAEG